MEALDDAYRGEQEWEKLVNFIGKISAEAPVLFTRFVVFGLKDFLYAIFERCTRARQEEKRARN